MSIIKQDYGEIGGSGINIDSLVLALTNYRTVDSDSSGNISGFTIGKTYFISTSRGNTTPVGITSGATELWKCTFSDGWSIYLGIVVATATTIKFYGSGNGTFIAQLD